MADKKFDYVIFGATGFTGEFVVEQLAKVVDGRSWAVAGRSNEKLTKTLAKVSKKLGYSIEHIPKIICDVSNCESLVKMAREAKVVLNTVGPYRFYGEPVVKACVENGASHVDISGEPLFLEKMSLKYHEAAAKAGVYIVGACGWDSIPCDMGIQYAMQQFHGTLDSVETFAEVKFPKGLTAHYGTYHTLIHSVSCRNELKPIRKELTADYPLPKTGTTKKLPSKGLLFYDKRCGGWCIPFLGSDRTVVGRSMRMNYKIRDWRPVHAQTYIKTPNLLSALVLMCWGVMFFLMSSFEVGRRLLENYPRFFSMGFFSHEGPTEEQLKATSFTTYIFGNGWRDKKVKAEEAPPTTVPEDRIICTVTGGEPAYVATSSFLVASALTLLEDRQLLPAKGGVYTPGTAFANTKLVDRLAKMNIQFKNI